MAVRIKFDNTHNAIQPTLVLATRGGRKLGKIPSLNIVFKDGMNECSEMSFRVNKVDCKTKFWEQLVDFRLVWVREWDKWFEIYVELDESNDTVKNISAKALGEAELSQINLYNIEINTEDDILRDDYEPTVLFNETNPNASLLSRIMEKAPHYKIRHVDFSIAKIQRTFTFDGQSIYDSFQEIAEEISCLFIIDCHSDSNGNIVREIDVFDLESYCLNCGERGAFNNSCEKCNSENIKHGYGEDTTIFISTENLADNIKYSTDNGSVKNCFKLEAGDDLMTATLVNCNPNGSGYIWYISDATKEDMSTELVSKLEEYDRLYEYYQKEYQSHIPANILAKYNNLVEKYKVYSTDYKTITSPIVGYPALMENYYNTIDFYLYLNNSLMPNVEMQETTATLEAAKLNYANLSPVAVKNLESCSAATAESAVLAMAKTIVDGRYQVKISDTTFSNRMWSGVFIITNYSDEEDTATSARATCEINDNYENYVKQRIDKTLHKAVSNDVTDIVQLFDLQLDDFSKELKKYSLSRLTSFHDCCQSCLDILIEQGVADRKTWADKEPDLYTKLYLPYYNKLDAIEKEMKLREEEIAVIIGTYDKDDDLTSEGMQTFLDSEKNKIQDILDFEKYLGENLWLEFVAYRREDTYQNENYISDGLDNSELFKTALEFIEVAKKDIFKSATLQHSISATLKNLLAIKEFEPIVKYFEVGNWLRVRVDENIYRLRLLNYEVDFDNLENIAITFSDVTIVPSGTSDVESILNQASSMASSYGSVSRQANKGKKGNEKLDNWVTKGLALTKMKIVDSADNQNITWDSHGLLCKEYLPITDSYDEKQLKIINRGLYLTDDNWLTSRAGIGNFSFYNPETEKFEEAYGVIADTLVGSLVLSEKVGVYNTENSITLGEKGIVITTDNTESSTNQMVFTIQKKKLDDDGNVVLDPTMYIDEEGNVVLNGTIRINSSSNTSATTLDDLADTSRFSQEITEQIYEEVYGEDGVYSTIESKYLDMQKYADSILNEYKADLGQYLSYDENGLTLGASTSAFKTVIDNQGMYFKQGDTIVSYVNNNQLNIPNAVINQSLIIGKYFFSARSDGGFSVSWQSG